MSPATFPPTRAGATLATVVIVDDSAVARAVTMAVVQGDGGFPLLAPVGEPGTGLATGESPLAGHAAGEVPDAQGVPAAGPAAPKAVMAPPPARVQSTPAIDIAVIAGLRDAIGEIADVLEAARLDVPARVADLRLGVETLDVERVRMAGHSLAGSVGNLGGREVVRLARAMEALGKSTDLSTAPARLAELEAETGRFLQELNGLLAAETGTALASEGAAC